MAFPFQPFEELVEVNPRVSLAKDTDHPFVAMEDVNPGQRYVTASRKRTLTGGTKFLPGDTLLARITPCLENGKVAQYDPYGKAGFGSTEFFVIRARPGRTDPGFAFYLSASDWVRGPAIGSMSGASGRQRADASAIKQAKVPAPPLETQRRIAAILGAYDDLIEVNRRRVEVLEEMARGLFEEWFVRFRFPGYEAVPILDTPDGPLPEGWEWRPFSSLADFMNGFAFKPSHFEADGLPIIKIPELKSGVSAKTPRNSGADVPARYWVDTGDLLFSWSGTLAVSEWTGGKGLLNQHLFLVRPEQGVERGLLKAALRWAMPLFDNQGVGATMKHIRRSALDQTKVPYPTDQALLQKANALFGSTYSMCTNIRCQNERLAASRDLLLPRLISGQLSVETAERALEAAA